MVPVFLACQQISSFQTIHQNQQATEHRFLVSRFQAWKHCSGACAWSVAC